MTTTLYAIQAPSGEVLEFFVLFAVILLGPIVFNRLGLPGLIGLALIASTIRRWG